MAKHIEKQFGRINIGNLDKIISCMHLKLQLGVNFNVHMWPNWHDTDVKLDMEAKPPHETCTHVVES